jgi:hypothetical protein
VNRMRVAAATMCLGLLVAACGGGGASSSASVAPSVSTQPSAAGSSGVALPSLPSSAKDLEALIPDNIGGITLQKSSMQGDAFLSVGGASDDIQHFLDGLGVSPDEVAVAFGFGVSADAQREFGMFIFRAEGAGADRLLDVFKEATDADATAPLNWQSAELGGKQVQRATAPDNANRILYLYASGDILVSLAVTREDDAAEALEALP